MFVPEPIIVGWHLNPAFFVVSSDPAFVGSAYIQESLPKGNPVGNDDKIYFFFSEAGKEFDFFDNTIVSRIARVCKVRDASVETAPLKGVFPLGQETLLPLCVLRACKYVCMFRGEW